MKKILVKYKGFSLIEMLMTIMILSVVMLMVASTLNTVIKVSNTANSKNQARSDINYIMDLLSRSISNSELDDIYIFNSSPVRSFDYLSGLPNIKTSDENLLANVYNTTDYELKNFVGLANEIHIKLYGYTVWTCFGYFESDGYGYIVKATASDLTDHSTCFNSTASITILNSFSVDAKDFSIEYVDVGDEKNSMFIINATVDPLFWPVSESFPVTKEVTRQTVVSTEALTWY